MDGMAVSSEDKRTVYPENTVSGAIALFPDELISPQCAALV